MNFSIVHCDNHLLIVDKEPGVVVQGASRDDISLLDEAKKWLKERFDKKGNVFLAVVHRLDKPVSGLILFARTSKAASRLSAQFRQGFVKKSYLAVVEGSPLQEQGVLTHYLTALDGRPAVAREGDSKAKLARLRYNLINKSQGMSELSIDLLTGRKHQIRVQLSALGLPIVGDKRYGAKRELQNSNAIALLSHELSFTHPTTKEELHFAANRPTWWPLTP